MKRCRPLLGTFVEIESEDSASIDLAFAAVERVHRLMSAHDPDSDLGRVNRGAHCRPVAVDAWTAAVIERSLGWSRESEGRFDIVRAGRLALQRCDLPRHVDQPLPDAAGDWTAIEIADQEIALACPSCLDLGGIAKGFAVDRAIDALRATGAARGFVNAGGDLRGFGTSPWPVSVVDPASRVAVASIDLLDSALATSAGLPGQRALSFEHLPGLNPLWVSVTVRAPTACDADALTKIVCAGDWDTADLLRRHGADAFALRVDNKVETIGVEAGCT